MVGALHCVVCVWELWVSDLLEGWYNISFGVGV